MGRFDHRLSLFLVRHGSTKDSEEKRYSGSETSLNRNGEVEAHKLAEVFAKTGIVRIHSSPYARAIETARIIQDACRCPLEIINELSEVNHGQWTGYTAGEIKRTWKEEFALRGKYPKTTSPPDGETLEQLQERTLNALREIIEVDKQGKALVVTHGGNIHTLWMFLLNSDLNNFWGFSKTHEIKCGDIFLLENAENLFKTRNGVLLSLTKGR